MNKKNWLFSKIYIILPEEHCMFNFSERGFFCARFNSPELLEPLIQHQAIPPREDFFFPNEHQMLMALMAGFKHFQEHEDWTAKKNWS